MISRKYIFVMALSILALNADNKNDAIKHLVNTDILKQVFAEAKKDNKPIIIDFFAEWCGPCKMMTPIVERLAKELKDTHVFVKVDVDQLKEFAQEYKIQAMPTIVIVKNGKELGRLVGSKTYTVLKDSIESLCKGDTENPALMREQLQSALQSCDVEKVKELIKKGVNVKEPLENKITPLMMIVLFGAQHSGEKSAEIINILLDAGAEWDAQGVIAGQEVSLVDFLKMNKTNFEKILGNYDSMISGVEKHSKKKK